MNEWVFEGEVLSKAWLHYWWVRDLLQRAEIDLQRAGNRLLQSIHCPVRPGPGPWLAAPATCRAGLRKHPGVYGGLARVGVKDPESPDHSTAGPVQALFMAILPGHERAETNVRVCVQRLKGECSP